MVTEMTDRTVAAWENLDEKNLMPDDMRKSIGEQIMTVARSISQAVTQELQSRCWSSTRN
jgi:hypothetical protein